MSSITQDTFVNHPDWVSLQSSQLHRGVYVVLNYDTFQPVFGKIVDLAVLDTTIIILCVLEFYGHAFMSH